MRSTVDFTAQHVGTALRLQGAWLASVLTASIAIRILLFAAPGRLEIFPGRADIAIVLGIVDKVGTFKGAIIVAGFVPYRDMRRNPFLLDQPSQHGGRAIIGIAHQQLDSQ